MSVFVGHGLGSTSFVLGVAKKSEVPICSARTSLTYPSSFCQAGIRTTAGDPWLCKLQRNKHELPVNTPSPNTHSLLVLQMVSSRFVPMVLSYPDDSYPGLDVSYPHSASFVPNPLDDSYPTNYDTKCSKRT